MAEKDATLVEITSPQVLPATNIAVNMSAAGICLSFGTMRPAFVGANAQGPTVEWLVSTMMPPTTAEQLSLALQSALKLYEERFGKIPKDPNAKMETKDPAANAKKKPEQKTDV
jgi:hypothetical protein